MGVYAQLILCFFRATRCDGFDDGNYNRGNHNSSGGHGRAHHEGHHGHYSQGGCHGHGCKGHRGNSRSKGFSFTSQNHGLEISSARSATSFLVPLGTVTSCLVVIRPSFLTILCSSFCV